MEDGRNLIPQPLLEALEYWEASGLSVDWDQFIALYAEMRHVPDLPSDAHLSHHTPAPPTRSAPCSSTIPTDEPPACRIPVDGD